MYDFPRILSLGLFASVNNPWLTEYLLYSKCRSEGSIAYRWYPHSSSYPRQEIRGLFSGEREWAQRKDPETPPTEGFVPGIGWRGLC